MQILALPKPMALKWCKFYHWQSQCSILAVATPARAISMIFNGLEEEKIESIARVRKKWRGKARMKLKGRASLFPRGVKKKEAKCKCNGKFLMFVMKMCNVNVHGKYNVLHMRKKILQNQRARRIFKSSSKSSRFQCSS